MQLSPPCAGNRLAVGRAGIPLEKTTVVRSGPNTERLRPQEPVPELRHGRGLAAARRADDRYKLALSYRKVHAAERRDPARSRLEYLDDLFYLENDGTAV